MAPHIKNEVFWDHFVAFSPPQAENFAIFALLLHFRYVDFYTKKIMPITATMIAGDKSGAYKYLPKGIETFTDAQELAVEIERAGFTEISQTPQTFGVCTITSAAKR